MLTADELRDLRIILGERWGLGRPLQFKELGMVLRLRGRDVGRSPALWEAGSHLPNGPTMLALELLLDGGKPRGVEELLRL